MKCSAKEEKSVDIKVLAGRGGGANSFVMRIWSMVGKVFGGEYRGSHGHSRTAARVCQQKKKEKTIRTNEIQSLWLMVRWWWVGALEGCCC